MGEVPPGPDRDRLRLELGEYEAEVKRQLLAGPPFPVYGLTRPHLRNRALAELGSSEGVLDTVTLVWGAYAPVGSGPSVSVRTAACSPGARRWDRAHLARALADERGRRAAETAEEPEPAQVEERRGPLQVGGLEIVADIRAEDDCWAALLDVPSGDGQSGDVQILVHARRVPVEAVRLDRVLDLEPFVRGGRRLLSWAAARGLQEHDRELVPEDLSLPHAEGFEAHRDLVEALVEQAAAAQRAMREDRPPPRVRWRRADRDHRVRQWEWARRTQMHLAGQDRDTAGAAVAALADHMTQLAIDADWFADPGLRAAAIEESIRWTVFESDVASLPAQQAWITAWRREQAASNWTYAPADYAALAALSGARHASRTRWLEAWSAWCAARA
jgi:hypothetical protein